MGLVGHMTKFDNIKTKIGRFFGKLRFKKKTKKDEKPDFVTDNIEALQFYVKYQPVIKAIVDSVSEKEIEILNEECPCRFRTGSEEDEPFCVECAVKIDGEKAKTIQQCEDCDFRQE